MNAGGFVKKVYDYDRTGLRMEIELQEGEITAFYPARNYGFAKMGDKTNVFFHINKCRSMVPNKTAFGKWLPAFYESGKFRDSVEQLQLQPGDKIVFLTRQEQNGLAARCWSTLDQYERTLGECEESRKIDLERLRTNPYYMAKVYGEIGTRAVEFIGFYEDLVERYSNQSDADLPLHERRLYDFRVETENGFVPCEDPRLTKAKAVKV